MDYCPWSSSSSASDRDSYPPLRRGRSDYMSVRLGSEEDRPLDALQGSLLRNGAMETKPKVPTCAICCTFFSLFAAVFLCVVAFVLSSDYPYFHINADHQEASSNVFAAAAIYLGFAAASAIWWGLVLRGYCPGKKVPSAQARAASYGTTDMGELTSARRAD